MAVVLPEPPDAVVEDAPRLDEGLADKRREAVDQRAGNERGEDVDDISLEDAGTQPEGLVVEPWRIGFGEDIAQRLWRVAKDALVLVHAGLDEPRRLLTRQRGEVLHRRVRQGVADLGMPDVDVGEPLADRSSSGMSFYIRGRNTVHMDPPSFGGDGV